MPIFESGILPRTLRFAVQRLKARILDGRIGQHAAMIHVPSQYSADRIGHFNSRLASRLRVIPEGVTPVFFELTSPAGEKFLKDAGISDFPFVLVPGGLNFRKNARLILDAWQQIRKNRPELRLVVVGHNSQTMCSR